MVCSPGSGTEQKVWHGISEPPGVCPPPAADVAGHGAGGEGLAQDVGDADPTSSPLQGNSHLQPPLQHPDCVSVSRGVGHSQSLLLELLLFPQAL